MINLLKESRFFKQCSAEELADIANIAQNITVSQGERIFEAGSPAKYLYIVLSGTVDLRFKVTYFDASREITLDRKSKGEAFGWSAIVEPNIYTLSAFAVTDSQLMQIKKDEFSKLCAGNDHLRSVLFKNIAEIIAERYILIQKMLIDAIQQELKSKER
jgi:CRP-like cAMP-binding protein